MKRPFDQAISSDNDDSVSDVVADSTENGNTQKRSYENGNTQKRSYVTDVVGDRYDLQKNDNLEEAEKEKMKEAMTLVTEKPGQQADQNPSVTGRSRKPRMRVLRTNKKFRFTIDPDLGVKFETLIGSNVVQDLVN